MELGNLEWLVGKKVTVMGLGLHGGGLGVSKWLVRRGVRLTVTDMKDRRALTGPIAALNAEYQACRRRPPLGVRPRRPRYVLGRHDPEDFRRADIVIRNPAVPREHHLLRLAAKNGALIESDISLFFHACPFPIAAVTGTKGKTTTTALLAEICRRFDRRSVVGGNIRISPMDSLDGLIRLAARRRSGAPPPVILELSSWQLESLEKHQVSPRVAVITNIMRDHLNRYDGRISAYAAAKEINVRFQGPGDTAVLNADDVRVEAMARRLERKGTHGPRVVRFSRRASVRGDGCFVRNGLVILKVGGSQRSVVSVRDIKLPGQHNLPNVLAAVAAADALGMPISTIAEAVTRFHGVAGRLETVEVRQGVTFINDTTATTPDASIAALNAFGPARAGRRRIILIAGGADKDLRFGPWAQAAVKQAKALVMLEGSATPRMEAALKRVAGGRPWIKASSMAEAVRAADAAADKGDLVILSPGCASFGLFVNEFDRGDQFVEAIKKL